MKNRFIIIILIFCSSCGQNNRNLISVELPGVTDTLFAEIITLDHEIFSLYSMLNVCDNYIVLVEKSKTPYLRIIDSATGRGLFNWGEQGRGPNEFEEIIQFYLLNNYDHDDCRIEFFNKLLGEVLVYVVTDSTFNLVDKFNVDYDNRKTFFNNVEYIQDGIYSLLYEIDNKNKRYLTISRHSKDTLFSFRHFENIGEGNNLKDNQERQDLLSSNWESSVITRDRDLFFVFNRKNNLLDIYNTHDGSVYKNITIDDNFIKIDKNVNQNILYRAIPIAGADKVYTVGFYIELEKLTDIGLDNVPSYLEEWNLDGTPSRRFLIDKPFGQAVVVGNKLYGFSPTYGNQYYVYTIPN
jgi:hypothetical protein